MNVGKTTTLLQSEYNYRERGMDTLLFIPIFDDRYEKGYIASRIGLKAKAIPFDTHFNFYAFVEQKLQEPNNRLKCVLVDEAHFLNKTHVSQLSDIADFLKIPVLTYGLRTDFLGEPFEGSKYLLAHAEELCEIKTICHCGRKATMNARIDEKGVMVKAGEQVEIGGNDRYMALCHRHFKQGITG